MNFRAFRSIRAKLLLSLGLPLLASYVALLAADFVISRRVAVEQMQAGVLDRAETTARIIDSRLSSVMQLSHAMTTMAASGEPTRARAALNEAMFNRWVTSATIVHASGAVTTTLVARHDNRDRFGGRGRTVIEPTAAPTWLAEVRGATTGRWIVDASAAHATERTALYIEPSGDDGAIGLTVSLDAIRSLRPPRPFSEPPGGRFASTRPTSGPPDRGEMRRPFGEPRDDRDPRGDFGPRDDRGPPPDVASATQPAAAGATLADFALFDAAGRLILPAARDDRADRTGKTVFEVAAEVDSPPMAETARAALAGTAGIVSVSGLGKIITNLDGDSRHWLAMSPIPSTGWFLIAAVAEAQYVQPVVDRLFQRAIFLALGLVAMLVIVFLISVRMSRRLERLDLAVGRLATGDLDVPMPPVGAPDEIGRLTSGFATMTRELRERIAQLTTQTAAREKVEGELRIARQIQLDLLPKTFPPFPERGEFELHAINEPALTVAGDFYDFFFTADGLLTIVVADVSGKGVPAALLMAVTRTLVRSLANADNAPASIVRGVNAALAPDTATFMFVTMFLCRYDPATGRISYVNAGHPPPVRLSASAPPTPCCDHNSPIVGIDESGIMGEFEQREERLAPGETLLVYTDGVLDAPGDGDADYLELPGLIEVLRAHGSLGARATCERLIDTLIHARSTPRRDDTTVLAIRRTTTQPPSDAGSVGFTPQCKVADSSVA